MEPRQAEKRMSPSHMPAAIRDNQGPDQGGAAAPLGLAEDEHNEQQQEPSLRLELEPAAQHAVEAAVSQQLMTTAPPQLQLGPPSPLLQQLISTPPGRSPRRQLSRPRVIQSALEEEVERKLQQLQLLEQQNQQLRTRCWVLEELVRCGTEISRHLREHGCSDSSMTRQHSAYCKELGLLLDGMPVNTRSSPKQRRPLFDGVDVAAMKAASADELRSQWLTLVKEAALDLQHQDNPTMQQRLENHAHVLLQLLLVSFLWNPGAAWQVAGLNLLTGEEATSIPPGHAERVMLSMQWDPEVVDFIITNNALQTQYQGQLEQETAQLSAQLAAATAAGDKATEQEVALQLATLMARKLVVQAMHVAAGARMLPAAGMAHLCVQSVPFSPLALSLPRTMECLLSSGQLHMKSAAA